MNPNVFALPCSFMISLLVAKMALIALNLPLNTLWLTCAVVLCTLLLCKRNLAELGVIAVLAMLAEMYTFSHGTSHISPDILLSVLITVILLPSFLDMMGLAAPRLGPLLNSH